MVNYDKKIEEKQKRLKLIEQEYLMTIGQLKELQELKKEQEDKKEDEK